ncbi:MAG TPA: PLP-dependent aminotransferase family protein [Gaiella sp.]
MTETTRIGWRDLFARRARADVGGEIARIMALSGRTDVISFAGGFPDPAAIDRDGLGEIMSELASGDVSAFEYAPTGGLPGLRSYLADRIGAHEGRAPAPSELLVTSGGIEAMQLLTKVFVDRGDTVVTEAPTYLGAQMCFAAAEAELVTVPVDDAGLDVEALSALLAGGARPKFVYTNPDHQNPAGVTLGAERRVALVELARRYGLLVVEDVAYREFAHDREPLPSLWAAAPDVVVQIGTFSKIFSPGTRLGWAVGPEDVVERLVWAKQISDQCASALAQRVVEEYGRRGHLDRQVERATGLYAARCKRMLESLEAELPAGVTWTRPDGGFFTWLTLPEALDATDVAERSAEAGVVLVSGAPFFPDDRGRSYLRVCFSRASLTEIEEGVRILGRVLGEEP